MTESNPKPQTMAGNDGGGGAIRTTLGLLPVLAISTGMGLPAFAQTTDSVELDPVILQSGKGVTTGYLAKESASGKSTAPLVDTPKTVTIITRKEIEERGQTSLSDVLRTTPGITLGAGEGGTAMGDRPSIRGFDATTDMMVDGLRNVARTSYESFNLESIEISKGPDGATSGRGSTGGTINLNSKTPQDTDFNDVSLTYGTGNFKRATLDSNKVFGNIAARLNLMAQGADDLNGRDGLTSERYGIAPSLAYTFGDGSRLTASIYYYVDHDMPDYGLIMSTAATPADISKGSGTKADPYLPADIGNDAYYGLHDKDFRDLTSKSLQLKYDRDLGNGFEWSTTLRLSEDSNYYVATKGRSLAAAATRATRQSISANKQTNTVALNSQIAGEVQSMGLRHNLAFGTDISHEKSKSGSVTITGAVPTADYLNPNPDDPWVGTITKGPWNTWGDTTAVGLYALDTIQLAPKWEATFGLRYDSYKVNYKTATLDLDNDTDFWNGSAGLIYKPTERSSIYARVGTSANPSSDAAGIDASNSLSVATENLKPERSKSYEIGAKWLNPDETLMVTGAVYLTDKTNARVTDELGNTELIGHTRAKGFELGVAGQVTEKFALSAGYTYIDAEYVDAGYTNVGTTTAPRYVPSPNNGNKVAGVVPRSFAFWGTYEATDALTLGLGATYLSSRVANAANTAAVPSSWQVDAMASYRFNDDTAVRLNVTNLFDETVYGNAHVNGTEHVNVGAGRTVSLTLTKSF